MTDHHPAMLKFRENNPDLFCDDEFTSDKVSFDQLGTFKLEKKEICDKNLEWETIESPADYIVDIPKPKYLSIDGEKEWKTSNRFLEGCCEAIEREKHVLIEGFAGYGKSKLVNYFLQKYKDKNHLVLNFCSSLIIDVWGGYNAKTVDRALGNVYNEESDSMETRSKGIDFSEIDILVVDECYMVNLPNLYRIKQKIANENPEIIAIYMGDPYQNELIVKNADEHVRPIVESQEEVFKMLAPTRIRLEVNKRSPQDQEKIECIFRMLFQEKKSTTEVLNFIIRRKWVNTVSNFGEIFSLGIDSHISYFQKKPIQIGRMLHSHYEQPTNSHQLYNGNSFLKRNAFGRDIGTHCEVKIEKKVLVVKFENGIVIKTLDEALECFSDLNNTEVPSLSVLVDILFQLVGVYRVRCHKKGLIKTIWSN